MPTQVLCSNCASFNRADATHCHACGRKLETALEAKPEAMNTLLQRAMSGEVLAAVLGEEAKRPTPVPRASRAPPARIATTPIGEDPPVEDHSNVIAAAVDRIRAKAHEEGHRFKPYMRSKGRKSSTPKAEEDFGKQMDIGVALLRERRFEEAIEPFLKAIARDDEDRRPWILLGEAYLRIERPYKAAVAFLRSLELSPRDEQAWLGLGRVLLSLGELPTAAAILERATRIHPDRADSWAERGFIYAKMQKLPDAARAFRKALELRPDHRLALAKRNEIEAMLRDKGVAGTGSIETEVPPRKTGAKGGQAHWDSEILEKMEKSTGDEPKAVTPTVTASPRGETLALISRAPSKRPARVRTFVEGLDETVDGGIPWGHVVLLVGAPGTMKSSLGFSILLENAARQGLHCLYLSLEERASSLLKQMGSLGLKLEVPKGSLVVLDPRTAADLLAEKTDWVDALEEGVRSIKGQRGLDLILIDSLEALEVLAKFKDRRREIYRLFEWLRDLDVTSLLISEEPDLEAAPTALDEEYLADGILHLRLARQGEFGIQRQLRIVKMRGTRHETGYHALVFDHGLKVTRILP